ncbi:MAG: glycosyl transferase [Candidatus Marinimicrobia bacterium]|nr:glycosyl transferase [Candidatus Neomarinimicrobiota bacterium]OUW50395.1 MAG: glycosyl transferase [bacterium TMED190]
MSDFHQNGIITTFHNFRTKNLDYIENELENFSKQRPMQLILPSLYSELSGSALPDIVNKLKKVKYLDQITIGLDNANEDEFNHAKFFFSQLPQKVRIIWHNGPNMKAVSNLLKENGLDESVPGKGRNVWYCMGYIYGLKNCEAVALHDCDILTYDRELLARLFYPIANPAYNFYFCKGYYSRIADGKMNGRVGRLLVTPLIKALKQMSSDYSPFLDFLSSFRYPLSGEFSFRRRLIRDVRIPYDWGLEVGMLSEIQRNFANNMVCQVDIADKYDHKHQDISFNDPEKGLSKMSIDISKTLIRKLASQGIGFNTDALRALKATYYRTALDYISTYSYDASMNDIDVDINKEEKNVELFAENIIKAGEQVLDKPMEMALMPSWSRVRSAIPFIYEKLIDAVENDNKK